jgi:hypothetical protein
VQWPALQARMTNCAKSLSALLSWNAGSMVRHCNFDNFIYTQRLSVGAFAAFALLAVVQIGACYDIVSGSRLLSQRDSVSN